jgi:hypothetical protein
MRMVQNVRGRFIKACHACETPLPIDEDHIDHSKVRRVHSRSSGLLEENTATIEGYARSCEGRHRRGC